MTRRWLWLMILGLALLLLAAPLSLGQAGEAEKKEPVTTGNEAISVEVLRSPES